MADEFLDELVAAPPVPRRVGVDPEKRVMIAMPWLKHTNPITAFSVMGLVDRSRTALLLNFGDAFVVHSRNKIGDAFLKSELPWLLTIDDDMVVPFGDAGWFNAYSGFNLPPQFAGMHAIDRLMSHGKTLVGALYFGRMPGKPRPMFAEGLNNPAMTDYVLRAPHDELKQTRWVGTGCMLIHRQVFLDIEKRFPDLARKGSTGGNWFTSSEHNLKDQVRSLAREMETGVREKKDFTMRAWERLEAMLAQANSQSPLSQGEDVAFCVRAAQSGHPAFVDFGLLCGHVGAKVYGPR